jgi:uncharacterized protein YdaU (DUF1376 family)
VKSPSPAFSFYPKDILSDLNVAAMTDEELGVYVKLLCHQWLEGSIPADMDRLARVVKRTRRSLDRLWPSLAPCFKVDGDRLMNARLEKERVKQLARQESQSVKGLKSAKSRVSNKGVQPRLNSGSTGRQPDVNLPSPSPSPSPTDNGLTAVPAVRAATQPELFPPPVSDQQSKQAVDTRVRTTAPSVPKRGGWVAEACTDWQVQYDGEIKPGRVGSAMKGLVDKLGWLTVHPAWTRYLAETDGSYASPERFVETYGKWSGTALPPARAAPGNITVANNRAVIAEYARNSGRRDG